MSIRPAPGEEHPLPGGGSSRFALGVCDGDQVPAVATPLGEVPACILDLAEMELGGGWSAAAEMLLEELGPFRLAYLEALVRIADWRVSA
jgi:CRISPR-associated endonuclease/helicase Cas3